MKQIKILTLRVPKLPPARRNLILASLLCSLSVCSLSACSLYRGKESFVERADALRQKGEYSEAIALYRTHLRERLLNTSRPKTENPYFYYLLIGDTYLEQNNPIKAIQSYNLAAANKVDKGLVADRFLSLGRWFEEKGDLPRAIEIIQQHTELDPLLFNGVLDRLNRSLTEYEQDSGTDAASTPAN